MRQLERRIREIQDAPGYCKVIVPIWFNAWHYADDNLWATLVTEVFSHLFSALSPDEEANQRQKLEQELQQARGLFQVSKEALNNAIEDRKAAEKTLAAVQLERENKERDFRQQFDDVSKLAQDDPQVKAAVAEVTATLGLDAATQSYEQLAAHVAELRSLWNRIAAIVIAALHGPGFWVVVVAIVATPLILFGAMEWFRLHDWSETRSLLGALVACIG
jgi:hypothetical protein